MFLIFVEMYCGLRVVFKGGTTIVVACSVITSELLPLIYPKIFRTDIYIKMIVFSFSVNSWEEFMHWKDLRKIQDGCQKEGWPKVERYLCQA